MLSGAAACWSEAAAAQWCQQQLLADAAGAWRRSNARHALVRWRAAHVGWKRAAAAAAVAASAVAVAASAVEVEVVAEVPLVEAAADHALRDLSNSPDGRAGPRSCSAVLLTPRAVAAEEAGDLTEAGEIESREIEREIESGEIEREIEREIKELGAQMTGIVARARAGEPPPPPLPLLNGLPPGALAALIYTAPPVRPLPSHAYSGRHSPRAQASVSCRRRPRLRRWPSWPRLRRRRLASPCRP